MKTMVFVLATSMLLSTGTEVYGQHKSWKVPAGYKTVSNPVAKDDVSLKSGMILYQKHCQVCHGKTGQGDGGKSNALKTSPGDLSASEYQKQSDGEQFYKTKFGRGEMPGYEKKMSDEEIWNVVNYMRTFRK